MTLAIQQLAATAGQALKQRDLFLVTAESCTGGGLGYWITSIAGSSDWFERGFVTYSNTAKMELLGVNPQTLEQFGAVSQQTAVEMAEGALQNSDADISVAITGIAGPDGGMEKKPVGTVWIAWTGHDIPLSVEGYVFTGDRQAIRTAAIQRALERLVKLLNEH